MKSIKISDKCEKCGACLMFSNLVEEKDDGSAIAKNNIINSENEIEIQELIDCCPINAISVVDISSTNCTGKKGIEEIIENIKEELNEKSRIILDPKRIRFNPNDYSIPKPDYDGDFEYNYRSYESAQRAGVNEFERVMHRQYPVHFIQIITEYKTKVLGSFFLIDKAKSGEKSIYEKNNEEISKILEKY